MNLSPRLWSHWAPCGSVGPTLSESRYSFGSIHRSPGCHLVGFVGFVVPFPKADHRQRQVSWQPQSCSTRACGFQTATRITLLSLTSKDGEKTCNYYQPWSKVQTLYQSSPGDNSRIQTLWRTIEKELWSSMTAITLKPLHLFTHVHFVPSIPSHGGSHPNNLALPAMSLQRHCPAGC